MVKPLKHITESLSLTATLFSLFIIMVFASCTQNDARIGTLFGQWQLERALDQDNHEVVSDPEQFFWGFQNMVVCVRRTLPHNIAEEHWGSWSRDNGMLVLDFTHSDDESASGEWPYTSPVDMGFPPSPCKVELRIDRFTDTRLTLVLTTDNGTITYYLRKLY